MTQNLHNGIFCFVERAWMLTRIQTAMKRHYLLVFFSNTKSNVSFFIFLIHTHFKKI